MHYQYLNFADLIDGTPLYKKDYLTAFYISYV